VIEVVVAGDISLVIRRLPQAFRCSDIGAEAGIALCSKSLHNLRLYAVNQSHL